MRDELERLAATYWVPWVVALVSVVVSKSFSTKKESARTVIRSILVGSLVAFLLVETLTWVERGILLTTVSLGAALSDSIAVIVLGFGERIKRDPDILIRLINRVFGGRK